jgi:hypothetical protein
LKNGLLDLVDDILKNTVLGSHMKHRSPSWRFFKIYHGFFEENNH